MTYKKMGISVLSCVFCILLCVCLLTALFDPYFHYHAPFEGQNYTLDNERYQNDGITRHFEYNAIITGTSMTENFKTTECDAAFGVNSIKIPYFGASFKEINDSVAKAIERNPDVKLVIRCLDTYRFLEAKDEMKYEEYPEYLYDDNLFNDVNYLLNKDIFIGDVYPAAVGTLKKVKPTTFDEYANWDSYAVYGKETVLGGYKRADFIAKPQPLTDEEREMVIGTVSQNIVSVAAANPDVEFYLFLPPYSIVYWYSLYEKGELQKSLEAQRLAVEIMLEYSNIYIFSFLTDFETVCDFNNYKDTVHYSGDINSKILQSMKNKEFLVTKENCEEYFAKTEDFYINYNYESIFE